MFVESSCQLTTKSAHKHRSFIFYLKEVFSYIGVNAAKRYNLKIANKNLSNWSVRYESITGKLRNLWRQKKLTLWEFASVNACLQLSMRRFYIVSTLFNFTLNSITGINFQTSSWHSLTKFAWLSHGKYFKGLMLGSFSVIADTNSFNPATCPPGGCTSAQAILLTLETLTNVGTLLEILPAKTFVLCYLFHLCILIYFSISFIFPSQ